MSAKIQVNSAEAAIAQLRVAVMDLLPSNPDLAKDLYLLRFLKSKGMDLKKAETMLRQTIEWRRENNIDDLLRRDLSPELLQGFPVHKGRLKNGAPMAMLKLGKIDLHGLIEKHGKEAVLDYVILQSAREEHKNILWNQARWDANARNCSGNDSMTLSETVLKGNAFIIDLKDIPVRQLASIKALSLCMQLISTYVRFFPIVGATCVVINCSRLAMPFVSVLWKIAKRTNFHIKVYNTDISQWRAELLAMADPDQLLTEFGGTAEILLEDNY